MGLGGSKQKETAKDHKEENKKKSEHKTQTPKATPQAYTPILQELEENSHSKMSVVGIDLGSSKSVISVARNRGIDIITNEVSNRFTPSMVSFNGGQRFLGEGAKTQEIMNYKNTVAALKHMLGRQFDEESMQKIEKNFMLFNFVPGATGEAAAQVAYKDEQVTFDSVQLYAMYLSQMKLTVESALTTSASDVVLSIPAFYTEKQRRSLLAASEICGLNCLRLMSEPAAAALQYGITRALELPEKDKDPRYVCFVDVGHSAMTVSICAFTQEKAQIKGVAFDRNLGGRDFDEALTKHFANEIQTKYKVDVFTLPKSLVRLRSAIEKCKKMLSANLKAPLNIECLTDTVDVNSNMTRDTFEGMVADVLGRIKPVLETALARSGLKKEQINFVELIGGSTRIPAVKQQIVEFFDNNVNLLSTTLNADEAVARGCCFQCAQLSPLFKVRDYEVRDVTPYTIKMGESDVFAASEEIPKTKKVQLKRGSNFDLNVVYNDSFLPEGHSQSIGQFSVALDKEGDQDVNVEVRVNADGLFTVKSAYITEITFEEVPAEPMEVDKKPEEKAATPEATPEENKDKDTPMPDAEPKEPEKPKEPKRIVKNHKLAVTTKESLAIPVTLINNYREQEANMCVSDKLIRETLEKKNQLEAYVYEIRGKLETSHSDFIEEAAKEEFMKLLTSTEDWLYDEGEDAQKSVFVERLNELLKVGGPVQERYTEMEIRPKAIKDLQLLIAEFRDRGSSMDDKYAHIEDAEKGKVIDACDKKLNWLESMINKQSALKKSDPVVVTAAQLKAEREALFAFCNPIMTKPKPKVEPPAETKTDDKKADDKKADDKKADDKKDQKDTPMADPEKEADPLGVD